MENLSFLTSAQVEQKLANMLVLHSENTSYRMQNYFNCVDDYSWGGICDQAQTEIENNLRRVLSLLKEQDENGGYVDRIVSELELRTLNGDFLSKNIINGKYGRCFMFGDSNTNYMFCGLSKKQDTFSKKGYQVVTNKYHLRVKYTGRITKGGNAECVVELISKTQSVDSKIDITIDNKSYFIYNLNKN